MRRTCALVAVIAVFTLVAGCQTRAAHQQASSTQLPTPPAAGHDSPRAAVAGFLQNLSNGDAFAACNYVDPDQQGNCLSGFSGTVSTTGAWSVGDQLIRQHSALVVGLFDHFCINEQCQSNADVRAGLAAAASDFTGAFERAQQSGKNLVIATVLSSGKWYVEGGVGLSPIPPS